MLESGTAVDVGSTLAALALTLDSDALGNQLGLTTFPAPATIEREGQAQGPAEAIELSGDARYQTLGALGAGGMGQVEAVWDRDLMRELAVKQLHPSLAADSMSLQQFLWEARVTAHLDHPNIVPVHDLGLDANKQLYFTMKRVGGRSLAELCACLAEVAPERLVEAECHGRGCTAPHEDPLIAEFASPRRRLRVFVEICQAIAYAHDRGVLHRDLKPANVMLGEFGEVLVMDWGLAVPVSECSDAVLCQLRPKDLCGRDDTNTLRGTPRYMAPELLVEQPASVRTDVYALGVMLYELLALRLPHSAQSVPALVAQITEGRVTPLAEVAPKLSRSIVAVVERAMAIDPQQRYASVAELLEDIEAVLEGLTPMAEDVSAMTRVHRYFLSSTNSDVAHLRIVDLDLTGMCGILLGVGATLLILQGVGWLPVAILLVAAVVSLIPLRTYLKIARGGRQRIRRDVARRRQQAELASATPIEPTCCD